MNNIEYILMISIRIIIIIFFIYSSIKPKEIGIAIKKSIKPVAIITIMTFFTVFILKKYQILDPNKHYEVVSPLLLIFIINTIFNIIRNEKRSGPKRPKF